MRFMSLRPRKGCNIIIVTNFISNNRVVIMNHPVYRNTPDEVNRKAVGIWKPKQKQKQK